jgi:YhcH/YjgK/YiaL family protein
MIVSALENIDRYIASNQALKKAVEFLRRLDVNASEEGREGRRIDIDGRDMFAIVRRYETLVTEEPVLEFHRKYIDVQYIVSGEEAIGWLPVEDMIVTRDYDEEKDICFGTAPSGRISYIYLPVGRVAVFYTDDGHAPGLAPGLAAGAPSSVCKVVIKVAAV